MKLITCINETISRIITDNGNEFWYNNDQFHRDNDLPAIILAYGYKAWFLNDEFYRDNYENNEQPIVLKINEYKK